jgi:iron complex outermembrane receptor protein
LSALYFDQDAGQGREFFHNDLQLDQYWLNASHDAESFGLKGLVYLNRADKTAFQDSSNDNYTSLNRKEKFKGNQTWGADVQATLSNLKPVQFTFGASFKNAELNYDEDYPGSARDAGAKGVQQFISPFFSMDCRFLSDNVIMNLGARYDWIETSDGENWDTVASAGRPAYANHFDRESEGSFSPKLGLAWHIDDKTTVRTSTGKGFRAPSLFELYKVHVRGGGTYYREANPDLEPEEIWSYDLGFERFITPEVRAKITFYQSFAKDYIGDRLIGTVPISGGRARYDYMLDNISEVTIYGAESEIQWTPANNITLFANYTWNVSKVDKDANNAALEGNDLTNDPRHKLHGGLTYTNPSLITASLIGNYYADIYYDNENTLKTDDYWTVDFALSRKFRDRFTVFVNAENLFDKEYPIFLSSSSGDTIAPGIVVTGGFKIDL